MDADEILHQAEQRKQEHDPVRIAQRELAPIRAWALKAKADFLTALAKRQPRIDTALKRTNRLTALRHGVPYSDLVQWWNELGKLTSGIPVSYDGIVYSIDCLTPQDIRAGHHLFLANKPKCPPGTIGDVDKYLVWIEEGIESATRRMSEESAAGVAPPPVPIINVDHRRDQAIEVESEF